MMNALRVLRHLIVGFAAFAAIATPIWFVIAAFGGKFGFWTPIDGFRHVMGLAGLNALDWFGLPGGFGGGFILPLTAGLGLAALIIAIGFRLIFGRANAPGPGGYVAGVAALAVGLAPLVLVTIGAEQRAGIPPIHDITTDTVNPPQFTAALIERRGENANPVDYHAKTDPRSGRPLPEVQAEAYPDIAPFYTEAEPVLAYRAALGAARDKGWRVSTASEAALMFEAQAVTFWFGFVDDVVVRVSAHEDGARVDARSVSRVGVSDLGANAARLRAFFATLEASLGYSEEEPDLPVPAEEGDGAPEPEVGSESWPEPADDHEG
ncbi:DUF1499 domain-containing protein [Alkalicaulis satelles]|uniref:DUF1499 domain-containing protein n=1 Tax=Alkalicaulis satelles TaxID=2609175 RepID=A0A5M6ZMT8_9PROT|nr:DUF1499 domain-containing protein [Alkalicaulis satelles]KAA5804558.1 DUF1499 domain-containing protein [Alkalicaulis satelles]